MVSKLDIHALIPTKYLNLGLANSAKMLQWPLDELNAHNQSIYLRCLWVETIR